jgi:hypothetical protein
MKTIEYFQFALLILVTILAIIMIAYILIKAKKDGFTNKSVSTLILAFGGLLIVYLIFNFDKIQPSDWVQIILSLSLVAVTGIYAFAAIKQANANVKMAKEMENQRYDTVRPVIDIVPIPMIGKELATVAYKLAEGQMPTAFPCKLRNIGLGPVIELYTTIEEEKGKSKKWDFGALKVQDETSEFQLRLEWRDEDSFLIAKYRDIYGRCFESLREVILSKKEHTFKFGRLKIDRIKDEESND